jgi:uncharacterized protein (DUF433 family)
VTPRHAFDPYAGKDPRQIAAYSIAEAAHYLSLPENTVRSWVSARTFPGKTGISPARAGSPCGRRSARTCTRIERDAKGLAVRLYPFTRAGVAAAPRFIVIDPRTAFGRPVIAGSRIPTADVSERFKAGDSLEALVAECGRQTEEIQEAIRYEADRAA